MNAPHPSQQLDASDLAIIETHPFTSELERRLVAEIRTLRARHDEDSAVVALEDCQQEAERAIKAFERVCFHLPEDAFTDEVDIALESLRSSLNIILWR